MSTITNDNRRQARSAARDYRDAIDEALTRKAREFDRRVATAPRWEGDGSEVWF